MNKSIRAVGALLAIVATAALLIHGCHGGPHGSHHEQSGVSRDGSFVSKSIRKQASITLHGPVDTVWPLFDPVNETKWAPAWQPEFVFPADGSVREGMVLRTASHGGESSALINERLHTVTSDSWSAFAAAHPDLFERGLLERYYSKDRLGSELARRVFLLPDGRPSKREAP